MKGSLTATFLLTIGLAASAAPEPTAVVTDLRGSVTLLRAGQERGQNLAGTVLLLPGDELKLGKDGRATLLPLNGAVRALRPGQAVSLAPPPPSARAEALPRDLFQLIVRQLAAAAKESETEAPRTRGEGRAPALTALAPRFSLVLEDRPSFEWEPVQGATRYTVTLYGSDQQRLWSTTTTGGRVVYPADRPALAPGDYRWDVLAR